MAVYKPKKKTGTNTFEDIKIPASCIDGLPSGGGVTVDSAMSSTSTNPVQNKVVYKRFQDFVDLTSSQDITGEKNFKNGLKSNGEFVSLFSPYNKFSTPKTYTATASGTISIKLSDIIPSDDYSAGNGYELYGQIFAYSSSTGKVFLYSNMWGDNSSTSYYLLNTTSNARVGSTAFVIPCSGTLTCYKNINFSEFTLRIYGYRRIR